MRFGATVTVRGSDGTEVVYDIVGVDESHFARGWVSWQSPLARVLPNARLDQGVRFTPPRGPSELEITAISYG